MQDDPTNRPHLVPFEPPQPRSGRNASASRPLSEAEEHRLRLAVRCRAILMNFWTEDGVPDAQQAMQLEGWIDVLEALDEGEVRAAWAAYQIGGPRSALGALLRPDAGALHRIALVLRRGYHPGDDAEEVCRLALDPEVRRSERERRLRAEERRRRWQVIRGERPEPPQSADGEDTDR